MSGHSHWAKVKRAKSANDAKRGRQWSKMARRIMVAAKVGGGNPDENLTLRYAIDEARAVSMPNDTIDKAVKKGTGELGATTYENILYEGYGPGGVAFLVDCLTDNRSRTAPEMRKIFERGGGQLGSTHCVAWMFEKKGVLAVAADKVGEDALMELALDAGADDVQNLGDAFEITCAPAQYNQVKAAMEKAKAPLLSGGLAMVPTSTIAVDVTKARQVLGLMEALEDHDDVQHVWANFEMSDQVLAELNKQG